MQVTIVSDRNQYFIGPRNKLKLLVNLLDEFDFRKVAKEKHESVAWEELAKRQIEKYTRPGLALRGARLKEGLTQAKLAKKLRVPQYNISKMENGTRPIGKKMAMRLGKALKVDYRIFL